MVSEHTQRGGRLRGSFAALSRLNRVGDIPVVVMLAWAGWLAVPWSFSGLAQARAAAAAAAADTEPPPSAHTADTAPPPHTLAFEAAAPPYALDTAPPYTLTPEDGAPPYAVAGGAAPVRGPRPGAAWGIPAPAVPHSAATVRPGQAAADGDAFVAGACPLPGRTTAGPGASDAVPGGVGVVAAERARIAGEVHDAAGHGLAAIAMQAGLALVALDDDPEQARASLRAIRETSTTALAHLRAALDGIDPPAADLPGLIAGVRAAGLPVDVEPADPAVPAHLKGAVYRVVRESLTNVLRHAGPTRASVRLAHDHRAFVLEVADRGAGWNGSGEGRGLAGMRAHVTEAGGRFTAGPREGGGFQVTARFPRPTA
ncbi:histidine kinase [Nonomuraea sp. NPDC051191]|uniref:histidine kinase n=1 Tax=Nonomuraea sp. NPDC051191 TaxID=3364372 RepID=UPI0037A5386F